MQKFDQHIFLKNALLLFNVIKNCEKDYMRNCFIIFLQTLHSSHDMKINGTEKV